MKSNRITFQTTMTLEAAAQNALWFASPAAIYALFVGLREKIAAPEIARRLGLLFGSVSAYLTAAAVSVPGALVSIWISSKTSNFKGSMIAPYVCTAPTLTVIGSVMAYGIVATGFPEELLFRGLIAGALFRRMPFVRANLLQAAIFTLPHLLILFFAPRLWPILVCVPMGIGLINGWLRHRSDSIWPGVIVHASGNMAGALAVMNWRR